MSRLINSGPPVPPALGQGRSGERSWPGDAVWRAQNRRKHDDEGGATPPEDLDVIPERRRPVKRAADAQARSRSRGNTSSL